MPQCSECGAQFDDGSSCEAYFHEMLVLEGRVPGAGGGLPHFYAVASYNLQHPSGFTAPALTGLRQTVADVLEGRATLDDARRRAREGSNGATRVRRRAGDVETTQERDMRNAWPTCWPLTVRDVCRVEPERYATRVREWAASVIDALRS